MSDWRTIRHVGRPHVETRPSREDEQDLTDRVRERETAERVARVAELDVRVEAVQQAADGLRKALGRVDRATYRDLDQIRRALVRLKTRHGSGR